MYVYLISIKILLKTQKRSHPKPQITNIHQITNIRYGNTVPGGHPIQQSS